MTVRVGLELNVVAVFARTRDLPRMPAFWRTRLQEKQQGRAERGGPVLFVLGSTYRGALSSDSRSGAADRSAVLAADANTFIRNSETCCWSRWFSTWNLSSACRI